MSEIKSKSSKEKREAKRAAVLGKDRKRSVPLWAVLAAGAAIFFAGGWILLNSVGKEPKQTSSTRITFPVSLFSDGKARHYEYESGDGITIRFFVIKSADGAIRAAFDACDVCWPAGKGYFQDGDVMICRNCGRRFASVKVNEIKGGCNPAPLRREVVDDELMIQVHDILKGRQYFNFTRGA